MTTEGAAPEGPEPEVKTTVRPHGAKVTERSPIDPKEDPQPDTAWGESDEDQTAKARGRRPANEGARLKERRMSWLMGAKPDGLA